MSEVINLLVIWFIISIPVAFFIGAIFTLSNQSSEVEVESQTQTTSDVIQDIN